MGKPDAPCRLFVYLARDAPLAAVLRRGPSDWARLSLWHTDTDAFEHGQWTKNRIYERRADVSPDGSLFVYFARRSSGPSSDNRDSWIAISRPPWFTALALWFVGTTYCSGGLFVGPRTVWNAFGDAPPDQGQLPPWLTFSTELPPYVDRTNNWTERTVHYNRLLRDGWERVEGATAATWQHRNPDGTLTLVMTERSDRDFAAFGGPHVVEYEVRAEPDGSTIPLGRATWADWDHRGRLIVAKDGRLSHWQLPGTLHEIADFNDQRPQPDQSPVEAQTWPPRPSERF
jgi:hypothetical protein